MPQRWAQLPTAVFQIFASCDLILHAGDVGKLWVLDELSRIAPVVAVHGNDDTVESQRELPYQQVVAVNQQRILIWHSHYPNRVDEMHARRSNNLREGCIRSVSRGKSAGASLVVFGHWHIPLVFEQDGVTVVNPGAFGSGNLFGMQTVQTVALLFLLKNGRFHITHVNIAEPERPYVPPTDLDAGFEQYVGKYGRSILDQQLETLRPHIIKQLYTIDPELFLDAVLPAAHTVWSGHQEYLTLPDLQHALRTADIKPSLKAQFLEKLDGLLEHDGVME